MASVPVRLVVSSIALAIVGVGPVGASGIPPFVLCAKLPAAAVNRWVSGIVGSSSMDTNNGSGTCRYRDDLEPYPDLDGDVTISVSTRDPSNLIVLLAEVGKVHPGKKIAVVPGREGGVGAHKVL